MAGHNEEYRFRVEAQTDEAISKLQNMLSLMEQIERTRAKGEDNYDTTTQKDVNRSMRSVAQLTREYKQASKELQSINAELKSQMGNLTDSKSSKDSSSMGDQAKKAVEKEIDKVSQQMREVESYMRSMDEVYRKSEATMEKIANFQQTHSKAFKSRFRTDDIYNLPKDYKTRSTPMRDSKGKVVYRESESGDREPVMTRQRTLDKTRARSVVDAKLDDDSGIDTILESIKDQTKEANKLGDRSRSQARRAVASDYMSHQQYSNFQKDFQTTQQDYVKTMEENRQKITDLGLERDSLTKEARHIETSGTDDPRDVDRLVSIRDTIREMTEEMKAREKLDKAIQNTRRSVEQDYQDVYRGRDGRGVEIKPERGTMTGMMYERAPAIGLATTGALGLAIGGLYQKGQQANASMRDDVISIGQRTGQDDWKKNVRNVAQDAGLSDYLGFTGQEMLQFQDNYLSRRGYQGQEDLQDAMSSQAEFSRVTGLDAQTTSEFFDNVFSSAKITGSDVGGIQDGFMGAIKQSGMEGREKEQLDALQELVGVVGEGRTIGAEDIQNIIGMQSLFAQSGSEALKGESGGQLLSDLNEGIRQGIDDPQTRLLFGMGTKYQGIEGYAELAKQMEKGIGDIDNVNTILGVAEGTLPEGGTDEEVAGALHRTARSKLGVDMSFEEAEELVKLSRDGELTQENLDKVLEEGSALGAEKGEENLERYQDSKEATENQSEATTEKQASRFNDFGDILKKVNTIIGRAPTLLYAAGAAIAALGVSAIGTAAAFGGSAVLRGGLGGRFGRGRISKILGREGPSGGGGGLGGMIFGDGAGRGKGGKGGSGRGGPYYGPAGGPVDTGKDKGKGKGGKGKAVGKFASRVFGPLGTLGTLDLIDSGVNEAGDWVLGHKEGDLKAPGLFSNPFKMPERHTDDRDGLFGSPKDSSRPPRESSRNRIIREGMEKRKLEKEGKPSKPTPTTTARGLGSSPLPSMGDITDPLTSAKNLSKTTVSRMERILPDMGNISSWLDSPKNLAETAMDKFVSGDSNTLKSKHIPPQVKSVQIDKDGTDVKDHRDKENANRKERTEVKRGDNISDEGTNLDRYELALRTADKLLMQARMQNGIIGNPNSLGADGGVGGGAGIGGSAGELKMLPEGQKWKNPNDLTKSDLNYTDAKLSAKDLDNWINSKAPKGSAMRGMGEAFFKAGQESGLDPRYLVAHAAEESGWGTSNIVKKKNNWFGIGAFDNSPMSSAHSFGDKEKGIIEGAKWIAKNYYDNGETTLRDMNKRYATNPQWASNIAGIMKGAPTGTGTVKVDSNVTVNVNSGGSLTGAARSSTELAQLGKTISDKIYGSMAFHSKDMRRA